MFGMKNGDRNGCYGGLKDERGCVILNEGEGKKKLFFFEILFYFF